MRADQLSTRSDKTLRELPTRDVIVVHNFMREMYRITPGYYPASMMYAHGWRDTEAELKRRSRVNGRGVPLCREAAKWTQDLKDVAP